MKIKALTGIFSLVLVFAPAGAGAAAYCREPQSPRAPYAKPSPPSCLSMGGYGRESECDQRELDNYTRAVDAYERKLQEYIDDAQRYADAAADYARCESQNARDALR